MLRRGTALFLTTVTVWVLSLTADMGAAAQTFQTLAESPAFVSAALRAVALRCSPAYAKLLFSENPARILRDRDIVRPDEF